MGLGQRNEEQESLSVFVWRPFPALFLPKYISRYLHLAKRTALARFSRATVLEFIIDSHQYCHCVTAVKNHFAAFLHSGRRLRWSQELTVPAPVYPQSYSAAPIITRSFRCFSIIFHQNPTAC